MGLGDRRWVELGRNLERINRHQAEYDSCQCAQVFIGTHPDCILYVPGDECCLFQMIISR